MKKVNLPISVSVIAVSALMAFIYPSSPPATGNPNPPQEKVVSPFPENIDKLFESSCFDCHSDKSSNEKALEKMDLSKYTELTPVKKISILQDIADILKKGKMPPAKYVDKYPDRAPSQEQKDTIIKWAEDEADKILGN